MIAKGSIPQSAAGEFGFICASVELFRAGWIIRLVRGLLRVMQALLVAGRRRADETPAHAPEVGEIIEADRIGGLLDRCTATEPKRPWNKRLVTTTQALR